MSEQIIFPVCTTVSTGCEYKALKMTEYYILAWLSFYYALVILSALVGFWIRNKYFENEKITQIEYGIVSEKPILCKMIASNEENKQASEIII